MLNREWTESITDCAVKVITVSQEEITSKKRAIVQFGPPTTTSGFRAGEYYQCTLDPDMVSPSGEFIRFDASIQGGELHGWQRIEAITVCEILGDGVEYPLPEGCIKSEEPLIIGVMQNG